MVVVDAFGKLRRDTDVATACVQVGVRHDNATLALIAVYRKAIFEHPDHDGMFTRLTGSFGDADRNAVVVIVGPVNECVPITFVQKRHMIVNNLVVLCHDCAFPVFVIIKKLRAAKRHADASQ